MRPAELTLCVTAVLILVQAAAAQGTTEARREWYRRSIVNLHFDNHSRLFGQGMTVDEIVEILRPLRVSMIQVSARSGGGATYPTIVGVPAKGAEEYDTLAVWREVTGRLGTRLGIYINTIGDKPLLDANPGKWRRVNAAGTVSDDRVCILPSVAGTGYLEQVHIPQVLEIIEGYDPDSFWFDGDWSIGEPCYCAECVAAWRKETGKDDPPRSAEDPDWPQWLSLFQRRQDEYKRAVADAIHGANPRCMYTSNWSWIASHSDPRTAPDWVDTLSADVGAGTSQGATRWLRSTVLYLQAQNTPYDMLPAIYPKAVRSLPRMIQECGLTMAGGAVCYLWLNNLDERQMLHGRTCVDFVRAREPVLGPTQSASPTAVLVSETAWAREVRGAEKGFWQRDAVLGAALDLQEAHYALDLVNEDTLRARAGQYGLVVIPDQRVVAAETLAVLRGIAERGGTVLLTGAALLEPTGESEEIERLLGLRREGLDPTGRVTLRLGQTDAVLAGAWRATPADAEVLTTLSDGRPGLTRKRLGEGWLAYLALPAIPYPDFDRVLASALRALGLGPVAVPDADLEQPLVFSLRRRGAELHLHIVDLSTRVKGDLVDLDSTHATEPNPPITDLQLAMRVAGPVREVRVVPDTVGVRWQCDEGYLLAGLTGFQDHAALIIETEGEPSLPVASLGAETPLPAATPHPVPRVLLADDFETDGGPLGSFRKEGVAITDETAATGARSLRFSDGPDYAKPFYPYINPAMPPAPLRGHVRVSLALWLEEDARVVVECRDHERSGPLVRFTEDGSVEVDGSKVGTVPHDAWFTLELTLSLEEPWYDGLLRVAGREDQALGRHKYRTEEFRRPETLYLVGEGTRKAAFYVDDVVVERLLAD